MFKSFFPKPGPFFISAFMWSLLAVIFWQAGGGDWLLRVTGASQDVAISAARFWSLNYTVFYAFYVFCVGVFALFWFIYSPHRWQYWSILGTSLIIFVTVSGRGRGGDQHWYARSTILFRPRWRRRIRSALTSFIRRLASFSASRLSRWSSG